MTALSHLLREAMSEHARAGRVAFVTEDGSVSYQEVRDLVDAFAADAHAAGVDRGELVGVAGEKSVRTIATFLGIMQAGGCPCFVEPRLDGAALADRMRAVGMRRLVEAGGFSGDSGGYVAEDLAGDDRAMMLFTSGSTGVPKGVLLSHANMTVNARGVATHTGVGPDDRLLHLMPLHHTNGVNNQIVVPLLAGATVALGGRFRAEQAVEQIRMYEPTYVTGVPTMYNRMLPYVEPSFSSPRLRFLRCGSAPITVAQQERIEAAFAVPLVVSYGLSEATCTSTMNPPSARRLGSVGTVLDGQRVALFHPGTDDEVERGSSGEVRIAGPALMQGYLGDGVEQPIRNGWLSTGDLGSFDADGYLTITGRIKDVIIRGGENLSPGVVEGELAAHPAVRECCVVGRPDDDLGEVPVAYVTLREGGKASADELRELVRSRLSHVYVPTEVTFVERLPVNGVGKIDRRALRRQAAS